MKYQIHQVHQNQYYCKNVPLLLLRHRFCEVFLLPQHNQLLYYQQELVS